MMNKPTRHEFKLTRKSTLAAELSEVTHGILKVTVDNKRITLAINDISFNDTVMPMINYSVSSRDNRSGYVAHKYDSFPPADRPEEYTRGACLNYATETGNDHDFLRIVGHVINLNTQEPLFTFIAYTYFSNGDNGWNIVVDDYVDHGHNAVTL